MSGRKEKTEPEEVPLNIRTDSSAVNGFDSGTGQENKKTDVDDPTKMEETGEVTGKGCKKICKIWQRKSPRSYTLETEKEEPKKSAMNINVDLENRDNKGLNNHIVMDFGEVFAEPNGSHSFNWTWFTVNRIFTTTSDIVYKLLAAFIAIPFAIFFGILFAIFAVIGVFFCTPLGVLLGIPLNALSKCWNFVVIKFLDPISRSVCCRNKKENKEEAVVLPA